MGDYILTLACEDRIGLVATVSGFIASHDGFILDSQQYADVAAGQFFMRVAFRSAGPGAPSDADAWSAAFGATACGLGFDWSIAGADDRPRLLIAVSRAGHCLNDLLHRWRTGDLPVEIAGVVSNHDRLRPLTEWHGLAFHHLPVGPSNRAVQERAIAALVADTGADYLVLARYMQILSPALTQALAGRCINIHHSFLPGFKGAHPYRRAMERGVKLIGATAHFVTADLDDGPIIEQAVERVDHRATEADLVRIGRDIEAQVLARAVRWAAERRLFISGPRTIVFR